MREETVYNPYQYTGRQYDAESGLYHCRARAYSPDLGRFLQQDPAGMVDGANMYAYCGNEPVGRRDPSGTGDYLIRPLGESGMAEWEAALMSDSFNTGVYRKRCIQNAAYLCDNLVRQKYYMQAHEKVPTWTDVYLVPRPPESRDYLETIYKEWRECMDERVGSCMVSYYFGNLLLGMHLGTPWSWNKKFRLI